ncbi:S-methyl-5-thioribose-1-phosphate isomerase [candidate division KSB1 bacterium]|nr:S-methyl-5-thioribose-1-phosphate isomerase [candidate division KSB1 bacterium]
MPLNTIEWKNGAVRLIDQTKLPIELEYLQTDDYQVLGDAIRQLKVRGAPAIGIAAGFGVVLGVQHLRDVSQSEFISKGLKIIDYLAGTRPTAVNLFWALGRMRAILEQSAGEMSIEQTKARLLREAQDILEEDRKICRNLGRNGASLLPDNATVLTHCNAGSLATADYGTAIGVIYAASEEGKNIRVYADETRPLLQGARLTTWELMQNKIDVTLICDNTAAFVMQQGKIDCVLVGADRIAANGDTANKVGTYNVAVLAHHHQIPFYVVAPVSTLDLTLENGSRIPIEQRASEEVTMGFGKRTAPSGVKVFSPAFDVTPHKLITAIVTEKGIARGSYRDKLKKFKNNT